MRVLKRRAFARWQAGEGLYDASLCEAVENMEKGLIDADLGGSLYKMRVARPGGGKRGGYRTVLSARIGERYVFLHGFAKNDMANVSPDETRALRFAGKVFLALSPVDLARAVDTGLLTEVRCAQ